jgi:cytochrome c oxidase assembly protein subunit 19
MVEYLACLKRVKGTNDQTCRLIAKEYLKCRMDRQLMAKDEMVNLGFQDEVEKKREEVASVGANRLEELKRENARLVEERRKKEATERQR